jgi:glycosyltransferase involved in cell wall biosynthesis
MRLTVVSHKVCWESPASPSGHASNGGFPLQVGAISELFDEIRLIVPVARTPRPIGELILAGNSVSVVPLDVPTGRNWVRKLLLPAWLFRNLSIIIREIRQADAVHALIPGDIGTFGLLIALVLRKPLFVRYCANWIARKTTAERLWGWLLERIAGGRIVVLATGGSSNPPSTRNATVSWIFTTTLREIELKKYAKVRTRFTDKGPQLIIACRQERPKGTGTLIETLPLLLDVYPDISLDVLGDGNALPEFRRIAERCGVADRVRFRGRVDHVTVMQLLKTADLFCFPSTSAEAFPKAVLEALACGIPVVSTRVADFASGEMIGAGGGVLVDAATPVEVARGIRWCLADADRYHNLSLAAVRIASRYSLEQWRDMIGSCLRSGWGPLRSIDA